MAGLKEVSRSEGWLVFPVVEQVVTLVDHVSALEAE
jgi:hypothetical protein